jgi:hypothetical protein
VAGHARGHARQEDPACAVGLKRWARKVRRRKPGIYCYVTQKHLRPWSKEIGYIGKSNRLDLRDGQHATKGWWDLKVRRYCLKLPWWLGWDWVLLPLETLAIVLLLPRYNWQKNPRPGKVGPRDQALQRQQRDLAPAGYRPRVQVSRMLDRVYQVAGVLVILTGLTGWYVSK